MRESADPLEEKMTLFWHGHFATSAHKVKDAYLMWRQNQTFRDNARGNFGVLVKAMSRDPAMIDWLDLRESKAAHPNENFAREVMELFTLGEGNYTEKDVTEGARAFTGYRIDAGATEFPLRPTRARQHAQDVPGPQRRARRRPGHRRDPRPARLRAVHGQQALDVLRVRKPSARARGRARRDDARQPLRDAPGAAPDVHEPGVLFGRGDAHADQESRPVDGADRARAGDRPARPRARLQAALRQMGQVPFNPPSVKGWDGGKAWISTSTLLTRYNLAGTCCGDGPAHRAGAPCSTT